MGGQGVCTELAVAVWAAAKAFGTVLVAMQRHPTTQNSSTALALAVDGLLRAHAIVLLQSLATELGIAELADGPALRAGEGQVIGHHDAWDLGAALVRTRHCVVLADVQVRLEGNRGGSE